MTPRPISSIRALVLLVTCASTSLAGTIPDGANDADYTNLAAQPQYAATAGIAIEGAASRGASAVLIADQWLLTAAHNFLNHGVASEDATAATISFGATFGGGTTYAAEAWYLHPDWVAAAPSARNQTGADIALVKLSTPVIGVAPAPIYTGPTNSLIGMQVTSSGYGITGIGSQGIDVNDPDDVATFGTRRAGHNVIDGVGGGVVGIYSWAGYSPNTLLYDFDDPNNTSASVMGSSIALALEYMIAPGDSGGPTFTLIGGEEFLVGITSLLFQGHNGFASYGSVAGLTSVSAYQDWIGSYVSFAVIPEPASGALLLAGLTLLARRRRTR